MTLFVVLRGTLESYNFSRKLFNRHPFKLVTGHSVRLRYMSMSIICHPGRLKSVSELESGLEERKMEILANLYYMIYRIRS